MRTRNRAAGAAPLAIDLGSGRIVVHSPAHRLWLNEPTLVAHDTDGTVLASGRRALRPDVRSTAQLRRPVGRGLVSDPSDCIRLLRDVLGRHGLDAPTTIRLSVPATASPADVAVFSAVVFSVTGAEPEMVPALLAGATGAHLDLDRPSLICDLGAGLFEAGAILGGTLLSRAAAEAGGRDYVANPGVTARSAARAVDRALRWIPRAMRGAFDLQPLHLIGGEARVEGFADELAALTGRHVVVHEDAGYAVAAGLAHLDAGRRRAAAS